MMDQLLVDNEVVVSNGVVNQDELVQIILATLDSLGYEGTVGTLVEQSGTSLQSSLVNMLMDEITHGKWDASITALHRFDLTDRVIQLASFIVKQEKFFKLLDEASLKETLKTLRTEIAPLCIDNERVRELSLCILQHRSNEVHIQELISKSLKSLLEELQNWLSPTMVISRKRLLELLENAPNSQRNACRFLNSGVAENLLVTNHGCGKNDIPSRTIQVLKEHTDEVWCVKFSHNGKYLASSSRDCRVIIWKVDATGVVSPMHILSGHKAPVSHVSWSPDDEQILTCGYLEAVRRWSVLSGQCLYVFEEQACGTVSCEWAPEGNIIFYGQIWTEDDAHDFEYILQLHWEDQKLDCMFASAMKFRVANLGVTSGNDFIAVYDNHSIMLYQWGSPGRVLIDEIETIVSFSLSDDRKYLLISLLNEELRLWNISDQLPVLIATYKGYKRSRYVVGACLGGREQAFVASGSEDSKVYIWGRDSGDLQSTLHGHTGAVNSVSWNPAYPCMLASASDDRTVCIWGANQAH